jgi:voltage-gated potassium channel
MNAPPKKTAKRSLLKVIEGKLEMPMLLLSFAWLFVIIAELAYGMTPELHWFGTGLWITFVLFFSLRLATASHRTAMLKRNWLVIFAILVPILRFFPVLQSFTITRLLTATFGTQLIWMFASADFGMRSLHRVLGRKGAGYALTLTVIVVFVGAAGMLAFENDSPDPKGIHNYPKALWWTAMQITNIGSGYRPETAGGELLCLGVSIYAAAMFGYLTALLATFFVEREAENPKSEIAGQKSIQVLQDEVTSLRKSIEEVLRHLPGRSSATSEKTDTRT